MARDVLQEIAVRLEAALDCLDRPHRRYVARHQRILREQVRRFEVLFEPCALDHDALDPVVRNRCENPHHVDDVVQDAMKETDAFRY